MIHHDLYNLFDRVVVLNLQRRPDRLAAIQDKLAAVEWPLRTIEVQPAIDGSRCPHPNYFVSGGGAWGCLRSHIRALEDCLNAGLDSILVLEDDFYFLHPNSFVADLQTFIDNVPADWECLFLGGQHFADPEPVANGVVKCKNTQRTHAYALRGSIIGDLYRFWQDCKTHCDWPLGDFLAKYKTYAPVEFLIAQDEGRSDISGSNNAKKSWNKAKDHPVVLLANTKREVAEELRSKGWHGGRSLVDGVDAGFENGHRNDSARSRIAEIRKLIDVLQDECTSGHGEVVMLWRPQVDISACRSACAKLMVIDNASVESAVETVRGINVGPSSSN